MCDCGDSSISLSGIPGPQGPAGATGATGAQGPAGANGADGADGMGKYVGLYEPMEPDKLYILPVTALQGCGLLKPCCPDLDAPDPVYGTAGAADFVWKLWHLDLGTGYWVDVSDQVLSLNVHATSGNLSIQTGPGIIVGTHRLVIIG